MKRFYTVVIKAFLDEAVKAHGFAGFRVSGVIPDSVNNPAMLVMELTKEDGKSLHQEQIAFLQVLDLLDRAMHYKGILEVAEGKPFGYLEIVETYSRFCREYAEPPLTEWNSGATPFDPRHLRLQVADRHIDALKAILKLKDYQFDTSD